MTAVEARLRGLLAGIQDPCSVGIGRPIDIVSMGLVEALDIGDEGDVTVRLVLTQPTCWFFFDMRTHIRDTLSADPAVSTVEVEVAEQLWTPDRLARGRAPVEARRAA